MTDEIVAPESAATPVEPAAAPTQPPAPAAASAAETAPEGTEVPDWAKDPTQALREVQKARQEAADARTKSRDAAKATAREELLRELGLVKADAPADVPAAKDELAAARTAATDAARELAIYKHAPAGTDIPALLDSRSFLATVASIDPTDTPALAAAIGQALTTTPRLKVAQAAPASGPDLPGGQPTVRTYTRAQLRDTAFYQANKSDIDLALTEGRIH